jgi:hypothetical protein
MSADALPRPTKAGRGRKPLPVAALMATAVVSAFVLLMAALAQAVAVRHGDRALQPSTSHKPYSRTQK